MPPIPPNKKLIWGIMGHLVYRRGMQMKESTKTYHCWRCKERKTLEEFYKDSTRATGISSCCKSCKSGYNAELNKRNPELYKERHKYYQVKYKYGLSKEEYNLLLKKYSNKCANKNCSSRLRLYVDHCHDSNRIRGILCSKCNFALGHVDDKIEMLEGLIEYLNSNVAV